MKSALLACEITSSSGKRLPERLEHRFNIYPLVNIQKAMENGTFIVDLPIEDGDFPYLLENHSYLGKL
jgi:hypothetical protein